VLDYPCRGGKRLRPALLLWSCGLLGGDESIAIPAAAAVEIYHNWTLVHDDIIDDDDLRRNMPTAHRQLADNAIKNYHINSNRADKFGHDLAILAGDIQQAWAADILLHISDSEKISDKLANMLSRRLHQTVNCQLISGEALDVSFSYRTNVTTAEVEEMIRLKTGVLLQFCAEAGAAIALNSYDFTECRIQALGNFALKAGLAFQLRDDWLGIFGEQKQFGKPLCSDLAERKPTILLMSALQNLPDKEKKQLENCLGLPEYSEQTIELIRKLIQQSGVEQHLRKRCEQLSNDAKNILLSFDDNPYRKLLLELNEYLTTRQY